MFKKSLEKTIRLKPVHNIQSNFLRSSSAIQSEENVDKLFKVVECELRGNDPAVLNSFAKFATMAGNYLNIQSKSYVEWLIL